MIKCGADERRRRRLDGAEPLFSFATAKENANESLPASPGREGTRKVKSQYAGGILLPPVQKLGSEPSAAGGRYSEVSEWQRSKFRE